MSLLLPGSRRLELRLFRKTRAWLAGVFGLVGMTAFGAGPGWVTLAGHVPPAVKRLAPVGHVPATNQLTLAIGLPLRDPAGLDKFLADVYDPASPRYRHFLTPVEFTARFSASEADYVAVKNFALTNGFKISHEHGNRLLLDVTALAADVERAFHIKLNKYKHPTEARNFFAPDAEPSVEVGLPVEDVSGLSDYSRPHPNLHRMDPNIVAPKTGSGSGGSYFGNDFRNAYAPGVALTGAGQQVGLFQLDGYYTNDVMSYAQQAGGGRTNIQVQTVPVGSTNWSIGVNGGNDEVSLDIEMAMAMAPGLSKILVFEGPLSSWPNDVLNAMAASNAVKNLSSSWGWSGGPVTSTDNIFKTMAAQGQSFFNASGDSDAFPAGYVDNSANTAAPSSSPYITQVGGTTLTTASAGGNYTSETVWNRNNGIGSSGGISTYYAIPSWQLGINSFLSNGGSTTARNIPDVALTAEYCYVMLGNGSSGSYGGTSCAAPLWAGFMALVNQQAAAFSQPSVGFINPAIYEIANESIYSSTFHDTSVGNNTSTSSPNAFYAVPGYDLATGLGTPNGTNLINALVHPDPLVVVSNAGFNAIASVAGVFNLLAQTFYLTNVSAVPQAWSLINTSAWLSVSSAGGALAAGASSPVVVSLNSVASNLTAGAYSASLWFSNVTTGVAHSRLFTLKVSDPLVILPPTNFSFSGPTGGPFQPASQGILLTNERSGVVSWSLGNTSAWFNVSPSSGSLASSAQSFVTITPKAAAATLTNGTYTAVIQVTNLASQFVQTVTGSVLVGLSIVQNGGFETGDFTGWTLVGTANSGGYINNGVINASSLSDGTGPDYIHSGLYGAFLGDVQLATLSQPLNTFPGQAYLVSFWVVNPVSGSVQQFGVNWNTNSVSQNPIYLNTSPPVLAWTNLLFIVTATGTNTTLLFNAENQPNGFGLDDVTVTPIPVPSFSTFFARTNAITFNWNTLAGVGYQIQYLTNLLQTNWLVLTNLSATANTTSFTEAPGMNSQRFYRIRRWP